MEANENLALYGRFQMVLDSPKHYLIRQVDLSSGLLVATKLAALWLPRLKQGL